MPLLHRLARTGGTLLCRCLASMDSVYLLSEINPRGVAHFNPLRQAADWYGLVAPEEIFDFQGSDEQLDSVKFREAIALLAQRTAERGAKLVVRDWSHLDWVGLPFISQPPLRSSWDTIDPDWSLLGPRCASVRHPVDQYLSTRSLSVIKKRDDSGKTLPRMLFVSDVCFVGL